MTHSAHVQSSGVTQVIAGVRLHQQSRDLIQVASDLADRLSSGLRVVHVCRPWRDQAWVASYPGEAMAYEWAPAVEEYEMNQADARLFQLMPEDIVSTASRQVLIGEPSERLIQDSITHRGTYIVVGARHSQSDFWSQGAATSIGLMQTSTVPVLLLPQHHLPDFRVKPLRILVCDDLRKGGMDALDCAVNFATGLRDVMLDHVHISDVVKEDLATFGNYMLEAVTIGAIKHAASLDQEAAFSRVMRRSRVLLKERSQRYIPRLSKLRCTLNTMVYSGDVSSQLKSLLLEHNYDVVIFGRHTVLHWHPFGLGQMSYASMLHLGVPLLIAPDATAHG